MIQEGKTWGVTRTLVSTPLVELHHIIIEPRKQCSEHYHKYKWNAFYVLEGELFILVEKADYALTDETRLRPGQLTTVKPGEVHWFRTGRLGCVALELYYLEPLHKDIVRRTVGGVARK